MKFPQGTAFVDGTYVPISEAKISVLDWGFLRSDATYDVVHVWEGRFFRLDRHLERFYAGVEKLRLAPPMAAEELTEVLRECVRRSGLAAAYVEMILTRGVSPTFSRDPRDAINTFIAFAVPLGSIADEEQLRRGLDIHVASVPRIPPESVDPTVKNYHWLDFVTGLYEAYDAGRENTVLVDGAGNVTEGPGFNVFSVSKGIITTPARGMLEGITRSTAIELAAELEVPVRQEPLGVAALKSGEEVFITSTAGGVMPVTRVDGVEIGEGTPGPTYRRISDLYWAKHRDPEWTTEV